MVVFQLELRLFGAFEAWKAAVDIRIQTPDRVGFAADFIR